MGDLRLSQIWIYPIKSLGGITLQSSRVMPKGLQFDRRWMLVDSEKTFMTQRVHSRMALFKQALTSGQVIVTYDGNSITIPNTTASNNTFEAQIWDDVVKVSEVSEEHSRWFSKHLGTDVKLVSFPEDNGRRVDPKYVPQDEHVSLADAYPFLIIGQSSLDDLNSRLDRPISIRRFRPNFVFTGGEPYEEDNWRRLKIGPTEFIGVKRCARCALPTIDPDTAEKGIEPTRTLATYRKFESKVYFGQNLIAADYNEVRVGDPITVKTS